MLHTRHIERWYIVYICINKMPLLHDDIVLWCAMTDNLQHIDTSFLLHKHFVETRFYDTTKYGQLTIFIVTVYKWDHILLLLPISSLQCMWPWEHQLQSLANRSFSLIFCAAHTYCMHVNKNKLLQPKWSMYCLTCWVAVGVVP